MDQCDLAQTFIRTLADVWRLILLIQYLAAVFRHQSIGDREDILEKCIFSFSHHKALTDDVSERSCDVLYSGILFRDSIMLLKILWLLAAYHNFPLIYPTVFILLQIKSLNGLILSAHRGIS